MVRILLPFAFILFSLGCNRPAAELSLAGHWQVCLDSSGQYGTVLPPQSVFTLGIQLPGTLDDAGIGTPVPSDSTLQRQTMLHLQRKVSYIGAAWYQREFRIPGKWSGHQVMLELERVIWKSSVWIDGQPAGSQYSLSAPHRYDLTALLTPGRHQITIRIDNSRQYFLNRTDMAHAYTEETQIKWNGIIGKISLSSRNPTHIIDIKAYPYFAGRSITGKISLSQTAEASMDLEVSLMDEGNQTIATTKSPASGDEMSFRLDLPEGIQPWNEFTPHRYQLKTTLKGTDQAILDSSSIRVGFRDLESRGSHLYLNGERLFLRGTLECCIFPLTGHPPMEVEGWEKVFKTAANYGLNHIRFHSWCPPEAAFEAADRSGIYLQVELPNWSLDFGKDPGFTGFINAEADRILNEYGNHPSLCLISMGNELEGDYQLLTGLVSRLKAEDPRHLYTTTTYTFQKGHGLYPEPVDDFYITQNTEKGWIRGQGVFDQVSPEFRTDYTNSIDHIGIPIISHEIGQYSVYPDLTEINKYRGVLVPSNFMAVRQDLRKKGFTDSLAARQTAATGRFATLLYKEEIERALKTDGLSGFQLLDLHDFPGQGTALVGVLNAFWESKGFTDGNEWRQFCGQAVLLLWFDQAVYTHDQTFTATYGLANYSQDFSNSWIKWTLSDSQGKEFFADSLKFNRIGKGGTIRLGDFAIPLANLQVPARYRLELSLPGTAFRNHWDIWVYGKTDTDPKPDILETTSFDQALAALSEGKTVFLNPETSEILGITGKFVPVFWSPVHFPDQPGTMGLLMDPDHSALSGFPTEFHSNWQWWDICKRSKVVVIDSLIPSPIIGVIDNFFKNRRLGIAFEAKIGNGRLLFCSADLHTSLETRPVARQLRESFLEYMASGKFAPAVSIAGDQLLTLRAGTGNR